MRSCTLLLALFLLSPLVAQAQKMDFYAGYSYMRMDAANLGSSLNGWEGSLMWKPSPYLGLGADLTGQNGDVGGVAMNLHTYLLGAQVSLPNRVSPFVHALAGVSRLSLGGTVQHSFAFEAGGGADLKATDLLSLRLVEVDFLTSGFRGAGPEVHLTAGIVLHF